MTAGASAVLMVVGGGTAAVAALTDDKQRIVTTVGQGRPAGAALPSGMGRTDSGDAPPAEAGIGTQETEAVQSQQTPADVVRDAARAQAKQATAEKPPSATAAAAAAAAREPAAKPAAPAQPVVTTRTEVERRAIPFRTRLVRDPALPRGEKRIQSPGAPGEAQVRYVVTLTDGRPTARRMLDSRIIRQPQHRVVAFGTRRGNCNPDRCRPWGRAGCERTEAAQLPLLDSAEVDLLTPEDLDSLELQSGATC